jgi:hypothetical protein
VWQCGSWFFRQWPGSGNVAVAWQWQCGSTNITQKHPKTPQKPQKTPQKHPKTPQKHFKKHHFPIKKHNFPIKKHHFHIKNTPKTPKKTDQKLLLIGCDGLFDSVSPKECVEICGENGGKPTKTGKKWGFLAFFDRKMVFFI